MRILYIIESLGAGGKERRLVELIKGLHKSHQIELILLDSDIHYLEIDKLNIKIYNLQRNIFKDFKLLFRFNHIIKKFDPEIIHCWDNIAALHFGPICKIKKIPFINSMISSAPADLSFYSKTYLAYAISYGFSDIILSNSNAGLISFRTPKNKSKVIYNGFDMERLKIKRNKSEIKDEFKIVTNKVVGMTASFSKMKDYSTFVRAANIILTQRKDISFIAIGDGPNILEIKKMIKKENNQFFRFLGRQHDVESIVNIFDVGVLSTFTEGISNSIMEYMALSKPVIATDCGGNKELIIDKETGFIVKLKNARQLAEKIIFLLDNPKEAKLMGEKGKKRIKKYFSISKMIKAILQLYKDQIK